MFAVCHFKTLIEDIRFCIIAKRNRHQCLITGSSVNPGFCHALLFWYHYEVVSLEMVLP